MFFRKRLANVFRAISDNIRLGPDAIKLFRCLARANVTRFGENLPLWQKIKVFGNFLRVYLVFGSISNLLSNFRKQIGQIFFVVNCQILKKNSIIWSHWARLNLLSFYNETIFYNGSTLFLTSVCCWFKLLNHSPRLVTIFCFPLITSKLSCFELLLILLLTHC